MATPNIGSGVTELQHPRTFPAHVCWRFEGSLGAGSTISTPIFDQVGDGFPFSEVEIGSANVVRVPSRYCVITHKHSGDDAGARLQVFHLIDSGTQLDPVTLYAPGGLTTGRFNRWLYEMMGRRCQFRLQNTPIGTATGVAGTQFLELVWEAPSA